MKIKIKALSRQSTRKLPPDFYNWPEEKRAAYIKHARYYEPTVGTELNVSHLEGQIEKYKHIPYKSASALKAKHALKSAIASAKHHPHTAHDEMADFHYHMAEHYKKTGNAEKRKEHRTMMRKHDNARRRSR